MGKNPVAAQGGNRVQGGGGADFFGGGAENRGGISAVMIYLDPS